MSAPPSGSEAAPDAPVTEFSKCHVGLLGQLDASAALPSLLEQAAQARRVAAATLAFFRDVVVVHHRDEERELFPAVPAAATPGAERDQVQAIVERLTRDHREVEAACAQLEPGLKLTLRGQDAALDAAEVAALGMALHLRHAMPDLLARCGSKR